MSTLQNTPKRIDSNKKKAITYSLALAKTLEFQDKIIQIGIKKDVSNNKHNDRPSTAKDAKEFNEKIQCDSNCIWLEVFAQYENITTFMHISKKHLYSQ